MSISREVVRCVAEVSHQKMDELQIQPADKFPNETEDTDSPATASPSIIPLINLIVRPHCRCIASNTACCYRLCSMVSLSVCLLVTAAVTVKIAVPFGF